MPAQRESPEVVAEIRRLVNEEGWSVSRTARHLGKSRNTVQRYIHTDDAAHEPEAPINEDTFVEKADGTAVQVVCTEKIIKTIDDAIAAANIDLTVWHVDHWEKRTYGVPMRIRQGQDSEKRWKPDIPLQTQQHVVKLYLKRILTRSMQAAVDAIYERIQKHAPRYATPPKVKRSGREPFLAVLGLFDAHFGKLCWAAETGADYDLKIAERLYLNAVEDLMGENQHRFVEQWCLPIGNDFYHVDNSRNTTYNGTPQDVDGRYAKIIEAGEMAVINAIERLQAIAPVRVVWVPGNHDPTTSYHLARTVAAWFRQCSRVTVDASPSPRKYLHWHSTLLGLTHGNEEKKDSLPNIMATERPAEWAVATSREWLLGHEHRSRQWMTKGTDTHEGTIVRVLRTLTSSDSWHHKRGYVSGAVGQAAEVYWYGRDRGYAGHAVVPARK